MRRYKVTGKIKFSDRDFNSYRGFIRMINVDDAVNYLFEDEFLYLGKDESIKDYVSYGYCDGTLDIINKETLDTVLRLDLV